MTLIAVDFDGVLRAKGGQPVPGAAAAMRRLRRAGHKLIVHTCRPVSVPGVRVQVQDWLEEHGIVFDDLTSIKPMADVYLDDKALRFTTWEHALTVLDAKSPAGFPAHKLARSDR